MMMMMTIPPAATSICGKMPLATDGTYNLRHKKSIMMMMMMMMMMTMPPAATCTCGKIPLAEKCHQWHLPPAA
jgi:hypothetical protein